MEPKIQLTAVIIHSPEDSIRLTAFIKEFPEVVASGNTEEELFQNLKLDFISMLEIRKAENPVTFNDKTTEKPFELA